MTSQLLKIKKTAGNHFVAHTTIRSTICFLQIASYGVPADQEVYDTTTRVDNKKPAAWEAEEFHFPLTAPELALLAIEVGILGF
jgi:hypothetical protein